MLASEKASGVYKRGAKAKQEAKEALEKAKESHEASTSADAQDSKPGKGAWILEGLAASGLRAIRYAKEIPGLAGIDANDLDPNVVESMKRNIEFNGPEVSSLVHAHCHDARVLMMRSKKYDAVDLDPYGTPSMLLDSAVQCAGEGGLLLVTATDMANLAGNNSTACHANYGSFPVHRPFCHEMAIRILLQCIESHANRHRKHITPLLSLSIDFYVRVFVRIHTNANQVKETPSQRLGYIWQSCGCDAYWIQPVGSKKVNGNSVKYAPAHGPVMPSEKCPESGGSYIMGGPIWTDKIHDVSFVKGLLDDLERDKSRYAQYARIRGLMVEARDELPDVPLYYDLHDVCKTLKCQSPKMEVMKSALINAGFRVSGSHANPLAIKTDAPVEVFFDILRCWIKEHPINNTKVEPGSYLAHILGKEAKIQADFSRAQGSMSQAKMGGVARFVQNPKNWGPKAKHSKPPTPRGPATGGKEAKLQIQDKEEAAAAAAEVEGEQGDEDPMKKKQRTE
jgi:tRNA (guanine26-N2/guanine27-N2)-dimethyltransferase